METCPVCSCLITENKCVICGYELNKSNTKQINNGSIFDIFDFIDARNVEPINKEVNQESNIKSNKNSKTSTKYDKEKYIEVKYDENIKEEVKNNKNISYNNQHNTIKPTIKKEESKKIFKINTIIYIILFFINPSLSIIFIILGGIVESVSKTKNKN